jgi:hypothetical protein
MLFKSVVNPSDLIVYQDVDESTTADLLGTIDLTDPKGELRLLPTGFLKGRTLKITIENDTIDAEMTIYQMEIYYMIYERTY